MNSILQIIKHAKLRLQVNTALQQHFRISIVICFCVLVAAIIDRSGSSSMFQWEVLPIVLVVGLVLNIAVRLFSKPFTSIDTANEVDRRFQLKDRISSALLCQNLKNPFAKVVIADAIETVNEMQVSSKVSKAFPILMPRGIGSIGLVASLIAVVLFLPQWNLWGNPSPNQPSVVLTPSVDRVEESIDNIIAQIEEDNEMRDALEQELLDLEALKESDVTNAENLQHEALRKFTDLQKRLDEMLNSEESLTYEAIASRLQKLELPRDSSTQPLIAALKNNDFDKAKEEFERLENDLQSESVSDEEKENIRDALDQLAQQMEQLAEMNDELASALAAAGLEGSLADHLEAAEKAIQNSDKLNEQQKKQLLEMIKQQQAAGEMCKKMASNCKGAAKGNKNGMQSEMNQMQALKMFKTKAELAKSACQNAGASMCNQPNQGKTGGKGLGNGGGSDIEETAFSTTAERSPVHTGAGSIVASQLFNGGLLTTTDSAAQVREAVLSGRESAERAINEDEVPRRYHELLRHYFGQLEKMTESTDENSETTQ